MSTQHDNTHDITRTIPSWITERLSSAPPVVHFPISSGHLVISEHVRTCEVCRAIPVITEHLARINELEKDADYWAGEFILTNTPTMRMVLADRIKMYQEQAAKLSRETIVYVNRAHRSERNAWYHRNA